MVKLKEDISKQADWVVMVFGSDGYKLDYTIHSFIEIDRFFLKNLKNGKPKIGTKLSKNSKELVFSISAYMTETLIKNVPDSILITDDTNRKSKTDFYVKLPNRTICFPVKTVQKRIQNGLKHGIYLCGHELTKEFRNEVFDPAFWDIEKVSKRWWEFW